MRSPRLMQRAASARGISVATISHVGSTIASNSFGTSITLAQPTGVQVGDVGILMHTHNTGLPAGWTTIDNNVGALGWHAYVGGEGSMTFTAGASTQMLAILSVFRNVHNTTPIDAQATTRSTTSGTTLASNAVTAVHDRTMLVSACREFVSSGTPTLTEPSGYTLSRRGSPQITAFGIAYVAGPAAGAVSGSPSWTTNVATFDSKVLQFLLRPYDT